MARASYPRIYDELYDFLIASDAEFDEDTLPTVEQIITKGEVAAATPSRNIHNDRKREAVERAYDALEEASEYDDDLLMEIVRIIKRA